MGGGHLVQRVELSTDNGQTWKYCFRRLPDTALRNGNKFWTWLFWECEVPLSEVVNSSEVVVRAFVRLRGYITVCRKCSADVHWNFRMYSKIRNPSISHGIFLE